MGNEPLEFVSLSRGAQMIDCSRESLSTWAKAGLVPFVGVQSPRRVERVFRRVDLLRFAAERAQRVAEGPPPTHPKLPRPTNGHGEGE